MFKMKINKKIEKMPNSNDPTTNKFQLGGYIKPTTNNVEFHGQLDVKCLTKVFDETFQYYVQAYLATVFGIIQ